MVDIEALTRRFEREKAKRSNWDNIWQEIAERVYPQMADFNTKRTPGEKRTEKMYDATAALAAKKAVAAISAFVWPSNQRYQRLTTSDPYLNKIQRVKAWMDAATDTLFRARYSPRASFDAQMNAAGMQHFVFGTGALFIDDDMRRGAISYRALHLGQTFVCEGAGGMVDTLYRCWPWTLRQIEQRWPGKLPEKLARRMTTHPDDECEIAHAVFPRTDYDPGRIGYPGMPWVCVYWIPGEKTLLQESGYESWPFAMMRYMPAPGEVYGRSPAWMVLSNIKVLNQQKLSTLKAAQKVADPPLLATDDLPSTVSQIPGAMNYGMLSPNGEALVKPLMTGADTRLSLEMMDREREIIGSAFLMDVFRVLVENPQMTATQTLELMNERAIHMAQEGGSIESEGLGPMTDRELDILSRAGQLPEMPPELLEAQGEYEIEYTSPMRNAMRSSEAIAIVRTMEQITPMAQVDATVLDVFDMQAAAREVAEINGVPAKIMRDMDAMRAMGEQRANEAQAAQLLEAAPVVANTAASLAKLQASGGLQPGI